MDTGNLAACIISKKEHIKKINPADRLQAAMLLWRVINSESICTFKPSDALVFIEPVNDATFVHATITFMTVKG